MNARRTYFTYFGFLLVILIAVGYASRNVIFRPWTARSWTASAALNGRIYLFGGRNAQNELTRDVLVVDPSQNSLRRGGRAPGALFGSSATALDGAIYLAGGTNLKTISDRLYRYDVRSRRFTPIGVLPGPREFGALVTVDGSAYYLGGWDGKTTSNEIIRLNDAGGPSHVIGHMPEALEQFCATTNDGLIYLIGGMDSAGNFVRTVVAIDPAAMAVVARGSLPEPAARMSATALDGSIYASGGWNGTALHELLRIERSGSRLTVSKVQSISYPILDTSLQAVGTDLYLLGGREQRFGRQIQVLKIDPTSKVVESILLRSYSWR